MSLVNPYQSPMVESLSSPHEREPESWLLAVTLAVVVFASCFSCYWIGRLDAEGKFDDAKRQLQAELRTQSK